ncbi:hypothetical protein DDD_2361 [Nonlabens dokdonensis DSW-6]|jgi:hypothetical protein|uniref:Uncharacterized protein n=1 Tax=Nonlabens dokdonensis (strain DSM 17205 / KCTC 12402 / DSW-6) TaxID=592029 RepID=L7WF23_NONDD|nr:hypothetical protein DDD_2361 [Nonlabens dokdonensis DSW-6]
MNEDSLCFRFRESGNSNQLKHKTSHEGHTHIFSNDFNRFYSL